MKINKRTKKSFSVWPSILSYSNIGTFFYFEKIAHMRIRGLHANQTLQEEAVSSLTEEVIENDS